MICRLHRDRLPCRACAARQVLEKKPGPVDVAELQTPAARWRCRVCDVVVNRSERGLHVRDEHRINAFGLDAAALFRPCALDVAA